MRWFLGIAVLFHLFIVFASAQSNANRVPPFGIALSAEDRGALTNELRAFDTELKKLDRAGTKNSTSARFLPEVQIFYKAVNWAVKYDEFYRTNEIAAAHKLIEQGVERAKALAGGKTPWTSATGLVVRAYRSRIDRSIQPYGLVVPPSFAGGDTNRKFRLDVWLHGRDNNLTELKFMTDRQRSYGEFTPADTFVLHPYGRYCNAFKFAGEIDVFEAIEHVRQNYPIDRFQIAIRGFSMGGGGTWHLAAHYPSFWAAAAPGAGFAETAEFQRIWSKDPKPTWYDQKLWHLYDATDYAANFFNCPVIAYSGELDRQKQAADIMAKYMAREGLELKHLIGPKTEHKYEPETKAELDRQFTTLMNSPRRSGYPTRVRFTTYTLRYNSNYWITVDGLERHWERADVDASIVLGPTDMHIFTTNVSALTITFPPGRISSAPGTAAKLAVDGNSFAESRSGLNTSEPVHLEKSGKRWRIVPHSHWTELRKHHGLQGPIDDAFVDSFIMVRPTGKPLNPTAGDWVGEEFAHATNEWRNQFRGDVLVKADAEVSPEDMVNNHLVLWGDPQSNKILGRLASKLPVIWKAGKIQIAGKSFSAEKFAPVFIFPNPLSPGKYIVVNTGFTFCEAGRSSNALQIPKLPDYGVLDMTVARGSRYPLGVALAGFFDERWQVQSTH
jgi:pimeloyl-ACP methyl ester carboxylesterase